MAIWLARAPTFAAFSAAFEAFYYDSYSLTGSNNPSFGQFVIRICDERGRIKSVSITPTHLEVDIDGREVGETSLELMATSDRTRLDISRQGPVHLPLPNGLPNDAWLWLHSETEWLDHRSLGGYGTDRGTDIRDDRPTEPAADVAALIAQDENEHVEFKSQLPTNSVTARRTALKTIVAFANTGGGTLLFGVDDDGTVHGLAKATQATLDGFMNTLRASVSPMPSCRPILHQFDGKALLVVEVDESAGTIYALTVESDKEEFYVRRGATTFHAQAAELQAVAQRGLNSGSLGALGWK